MTLEIKTIADVSLLSKVFYWNILRSDNTVAGKIISVIEESQALCSVILNGDATLKATNVASVSTEGIGTMTATQKAILLCLFQAGKITEDELDRFNCVPRDNFGRWFRKNHYTLSQEI